MPVKTFSKHPLPLSMKFSYSAVDRPVVREFRVCYIFCVSLNARVNEIYYMKLNKAFILLRTGRYHHASINHVLSWKGEQTLRTHSRHTFPLGLCSTSGILGLNIKSPQPQVVNSCVPVMDGAIVDRIRALYGKTRPRAVTKRSYRKRDRNDYLATNTSNAKSLSIIFIPSLCVCIPS